jgi:hypothetical protein
MIGGGSAAAIEIAQSSMQATDTIVDRESFASSGVKLACASGPEIAEVLRYFQDPLPPLAPLAALSRRSGSNSGGDAAAITANSTIKSVGARGGRGLFATARPPTRPTAATSPVRVCGAHATHTHAHATAQLQIPGCM